MMKLRSALLGAGFALASVAAQAQSSYPSVGGATVPAAVQMCLNASGVAVPVSGGTCAASGDATAANQVLQLTQETAFNTALGLQVDAACATDNGACTTIALLKRNNQRLTTLLAGPLPTTLPTTPTVAAGNGVVPVPSAEAGAGITPVVSAALESNKIIKAGAGNLYSAYVTTGAVAGWFLVANSTTAPTAGGAAIAPLVCVVAPINSTTSISYPDNAPLVASTGITLVFSSSGCLTNTASTTVFFSGSAK